MPFHDAGMKRRRGMANLGKSSSGKKEPFWWAARINSLIQEGRTRQAIRTLDRLMEKNQDRIHALLYKVRLLWRRGRIKEAIAWVCLEAELRPQDPQVLALKDEVMAFYP
jgi:Flp pilus assembly protein TadD